ISYLLTQGTSPPASVIARSTTSVSAPGGRSRNSKVTLGSLNQLLAASFKDPKSTYLSWYQRIGLFLAVSTLCRSSGKARRNVLLPELFRPTRTVIGRIGTRPVSVRHRRFFTPNASRVTRGA